MNIGGNSNGLTCDEDVNEPAGVEAPEDESASSLAAFMKELIN